MHRSAAGVNLAELSEADSSLGDATESDRTSEDQRRRMPAWAHALVDQARAHTI